MTNEITSLFAQTGWKRPYPKQVCQDWSVLDRITVFSYELTDAFMDYTKARMGIDLRKCECGFEAAKLIFAANAQPRNRADACQKSRFQDLWELFIA